MDVLRIAGILFLSAIVALILRRTGSPLHSAVVCAGIVAAVGVCLPKIADAVETAKMIANESGAYRFFPTVLKVAVAALVCDVAADVCSGCDSPVLSKTVSTVGKIEILFIALPLFTELYRYASSLVSQV